MANFGFSRLTVVAPYEPHWREAQSAVGAETILHSARKGETLADAVANCTFVLGTGTLTHRKPEQPVILLPSLVPVIHAELARKSRIALVFGSEKHGLTRDDLSLCHLLVEIPTDPSQPSMNLGQAVAVCLYELATRLGTTQTPGAPGASHSGTGKTTLQLECCESTSETRNNQPATSLDLDRLGAVIAEALAAANYSPSAMHNANRHGLHLLLRRLAFSRSDARRSLGLFRRILWQLQRYPKADSEPR